MEIHKISEMLRGWYVGNFKPAAYSTETFEVGYLKHKKGEKWDAHYHKAADEINLLVKGRMTIQDVEIGEGDIFILKRYEVANPIYLEDCEIVVIKTVSAPNDKYLVDA